MLLVVLDSDAFNVLAWDGGEERLASVVVAVEQGRVRFVVNRHTRDEVARAPGQKGEALRRIPTVEEPAGFTIGVSTVEGPDVIVSREEAAAYDAVRTTGFSHFPDAQVLSVAARLGVPLVAIDHRLTKRAKAHGHPVMHPNDLLAVLGIP